MSDGTHTAAYDFVANWPVGGNVAFTNDSSFQMSATKGYDLLNRLPNIISTADGGKLVTITANINTAGPSQTWGLDLSGRLQGAGGVGGLLFIGDMTLSIGAYAVANDGNGNIAGVVKATDATTTAQYEYGPSWEILRATYANPPVRQSLGGGGFRFSTKYQDDETDLVYYGYRYEKDGRWLSRDPITEPGFYLLATGHQASENLGTTDDGDGDTPNLNDFLAASTPNVYAFVDNDPVNETDPLGLIIIAFYGADYWGSGENGGANPEIRQIAQEVGAVGPYRSLDIWDPYQYLLNYFRNGSGACNTNEPIKIFGHSWGGISAVKLSRWLGRSELRNHEIDVYTIDPVRILRLPPTSVPSNVKYFWNRYQTHGGAVLGPIALHGRKLKSYAQSSDQQDLNPGPTDNGIDHIEIVRRVRAELIQKLKN